MDDLYEPEDIFDEDPDVEDWDGLSDQLSSLEGEAVPETDLLYVDLHTDRIVDPSDLTGRLYCTYTDKWAGFLQIQAQVMEWVASCPWLAFDIETFKRDHSPFKMKDPPGWNSDQVGAFSISYQDTTYVFKIDPLNRPEYTNETNLRPLLELILSKPLVGHNLKFDLRFMWRYYQKLPPLCFDTFLAAKVIHCERNVRYDLKSVVLRYLRIKISKEQQRSAWGSMFFLVPQVAYSARDTYYVAQLVEPMVAAMDADSKYWSRNTKSDFISVWNLHNKVAHLEFYLLPRMLQMELQGFCMDTEAIEEHYGRLKRLEGGLKQVWLSKLDELGQGPLNPNSSKKVKDYLSGKLGHLGLTRPDGTRILLSSIPSIDQDVIQEFVGHGIGPVDALYDFKTTTGNIKRIEEFHKMTEGDGRLYTSFKQWGAVSGRTSCPKPNLQNIKNAEKNGINLRGLFIAPPGKKLIVVDYSQIQLVIIAEISQDAVMRQIINDGGDLHTATAKAVSGQSEITPKERKQAKAVNFGYCVSENTPIITENGVKPIQNVSVGEYVLTHRGNWRPVTRTFSRTVQDVVQITTRTNKVVTSTPEHLWRIMNPSANGRPSVESWKEASELVPGMYLVPNRAEHKHGEGAFSDPLLARVWGWILSDGKCTPDEILIYQNRVQNPDEFAYMEEVLFPLGFVTAPKYGYEEGMFHLPSEADRVAFLEKLPPGLNRDVATHSTRQFSDLIVTMSRDEKVQMLAGLWEGDGTIVLQGDTKINIGYYSSSDELQANVRALVESLGYICTHYENKESRTNMLRITGSTSSLRFLADVPSTKCAKTKYQPKKQFSAEEHITEVKTLTGEFKVYDLEVADDHSFIANGLVSHNCFGMGATKFQDYARVSYKLYYDLETCMDIRDKYFGLYRGVAKWHKKVGLGKRNGMFPIETLYGRRIIADAFTKATNFPVQGTEKDIVALAISFIVDKLQALKLPGALVNCVHDELVAEADEAYAEDVKHVMETEMIRAAHMILKTVKVRADGHIVDRWSQAK